MTSGWEDHDPMRHKRVEELDRMMADEKPEQFDFDAYWAKIDAENDEARKKGTECGYCGRPGIGFSDTDGCNVCEDCANGISPLDPHGIKNPQNPLGTLSPLKPRVR